MTRETFEQAELIDKQIKQFEKDLDFVETVWRKFDNPEWRKLAEYTDSLIRNNIEELKHQFEKL